MISFTSHEILFSLLYSIMYGALFFVFYTSVCILNNEIYTLKSVPSHIIRYDKILEKPIKIQGRNAREQGAGILAFGILTFCFGLIFLFYYALDGCVRLYAAALSMAAFFALKALAFNRIIVLFTAVLDFCVYILTVILRIILLPFLRLYFCVKAKKCRILRIFNKNNI